MEEINNSETLSGGDELTPAGGGENDSEVVSIKDILSEELGREFPDDETALKAVKDTFSYVGKAGKYKPYIDVIEKLQIKYGDTEIVKQKLMEHLSEKPEIKVDESKFVSREQYDTDTFFAQNQELTSHRELLEALQTKTGKSLNEVKEMPAFKEIFTKAQSYDAVEKSKSVLVSNPRLAQASDKISQAREALKSGNDNVARDAAVNAVLDAYGS